MNEPRKQESGNALWFILLAVALIAALTATISRSTDTAEQSGNIERFRIQASNIMRHSTSVRQAVENMRLVNVGESQVSFENDFTSADYTNGTCAECVIFSSLGGGIAYMAPRDNWLDDDGTTPPGFGEWEFTGTNSVPGLRSGRPELIMSVGYLREGLCDQINAVLDLPFAPVPIDADGFDQTAFQGTYTSTATINNMTGISSGCFNDTSVDGRGHTFYQVLIER